MHPAIARRIFFYSISKLSAACQKATDQFRRTIILVQIKVFIPQNETNPVRQEDSCYLSSKMFIISQAAFATEVPGPKIAATPAL